MAAQPACPRAEMRIASKERASPSSFTPGSAAASTKFDGLLFLSGESSHLITPPPSFCEKEATSDEEDGILFTSPAAAYSVAAPSSNRPLPRSAIFSAPISVNLNSDTWLQRDGVLTETTLFWYGPCQQARGHIPLKGAAVDAQRELIHEPNHFLLVSRDRCFQLRASDFASKSAWLLALGTSIRGRVRISRCEHAQLPSELPISETPAFVSGMDEERLAREARQIQQSVAPPLVCH